MLECILQIELCVFTTSSNWKDSVTCHVVLRAHMVRIEWHVLLHLLCGIATHGRHVVLHALDVRSPLRKSTKKRRALATISRRAT